MLQLNNMTDETFTAYDVRGKLQAGASLDFAWNVGRALAEWLPTAGSVAVMRGESADEHLIGAVIEGLRLQGRDVSDVASGDKDQLVATIERAGYSGGVLVGCDTLTDQVTIELYRDEGMLIDSESGLQDIEALIQGGNFVPAAVKGELAHLA